MLALSIVVALAISDSVEIEMPIDIDTIEVVADIESVTVPWNTNARLRIASTQRDNLYNSWSHRAEASFGSIHAGFTLQTPSSDNVTPGFWLSTSFAAGNVVAGDLSAFSGSGLLLGSASSGFRSTRTINIPSTSDPAIACWKSRYKDLALRGAGLTLAMDSSRTTLALALGYRTDATSMSYIAMASRSFTSVILGINTIACPEQHEYGCSMWIRFPSKIQGLLVESSLMYQMQPSLQVAYTHSAPSLSLRAVFWTCGMSTGNALGSLITSTSRPENSWGVALSMRTMQRSLFTWNTWLSIRGSHTRRYDTPFPQLEYTLRNEMRQTITSQMHVTWFAGLQREAEGETVNGVWTQTNIYICYVRATVDRIIRPSLRWQARADIRYLLHDQAGGSSTTIHVDVIWKPTASLTLRARALHYGSPSYRIAARTVDYASPDLQRTVSCNGYGYRYSVNGSLQILQTVLVSFSAAIQQSTASANDQLQLRLAASWSITSGSSTNLASQDYGMHQPREENVEL